MAAANTARILTGAGANSIAAKSSWQWAMAPLNYGVQLGTVGGAYGTITHNFDHDYDAKEGFMDYAAAFGKAAWKPALFGAAVGLGAVGKELLSPGTVKVFSDFLAPTIEVTKGGITKTISNPISYITWPVAAVGLDTGNQLLNYYETGQNKKIAFTWNGKEALDVAMLATGARYFAGGLAFGQLARNAVDKELKSMTLGGSTAEPTFEQIYAKVGQINPRYKFAYYLANNEMKRAHRFKLF